MAEPPMKFETHQKIDPKSKQQKRQTIREDITKENFMVIQLITRKLRIGIAVLLFLSFETWRNSH